MKKEKTILARIELKQHEKLARYLKKRNLTVSEWIRDRINRVKE